MKGLIFSIKNGSFSKTMIVRMARDLKKDIIEMRKFNGGSYEDPRCFINLPSDKKMVRDVRKVISEKKKFKPECLVVVGVGGSNLGTWAVQEAVLGRLYNHMNPKIKVFYADTVDSDNIKRILCAIEPSLKKGRVVVNVVSKSGSTTETILNFQVILRALKSHRNYKRCVVVTTDRDSKLWDLAEKEGFSLLEVPKKVGGRYSVLSPVGLFPLGILGVDIEELLEGAGKMTEKCLKKDVRRNYAALGAASIYFHNKAGLNIHNIFLFSKDFESLGKWYRQLLAESIGKEHDLFGREIFNGITPMVSVGTIDLHSIAQLYLGGPFDKLTTFVQVEHNRNKVRIPKISGISGLTAGGGDDMEFVMNATLKGVKKAFIKGKRPFNEVTLPDKSAFSIGQFLQLKMIETFFLGRLFNVNPFDQPSVESYKEETRRILRGKR